MFYRFNEYPSSDIQNTDNSVDASQTSFIKPKFIIYVDLLDCI